jgi:hypothetical protein
VGSPTEEQEATGRGAGETAHGDSSHSARATVAESLADIRANRILADARREAQGIIDNARVEARREGRAIVDAARSEAETIITEAFEQRARIVRRDWAIGDGSWSLAGTEDEGEPGGDPDAGDDLAVAASEPASGVPTPADDMPVPVADAAGKVNDTDDVGDAVPPVPDVAAPAPARDVPRRPGPEAAPHGVPDVGPRQPPAVAPRTAPDVAPPPMPDVAAAAKLSELIELPALRSRERLVSAPPRSDAPHEPRPPLPARIRRRPPAPAPRNGPSAPPPPPPPPPAPAHAPARPRPRTERELPAGMRIPPDVPDWDDYDDAEDR